MRKSLLVSHLATATLFFGVGFLVADKKTVEKEQTKALAAEETPHIIKTLNNENAMLRQQVGEFESILANLETTTESVPAPEPKKSVDERLADTFNSRLETAYRELGNLHYSDLFEELMYSVEQSNAFLELWIQNAAEWIEKERAVQGPRSTDELSYEEKLDLQERLNENRVKLLAQQDEKMQEAFTNKYNRYLDYQKTVQERAQFTALTKSFEGQLDRYTKNQLVTMFAESGEKAGMVMQHYILDENDQLAYRKERLVLSEKRDKDFLDTAQSYLSDDQFDALSKQLEKQRKQSELSIQAAELRR